MPAFAIAFDPSGKGTGSGRSISGFDLGRMVRAAVDEGLLLKGGGHAMAAGLTVERASLGRLRGFFEERARKAVPDLVAVETLKIDGAVGASGATIDLVDLLEQAGPYGSGHPQPIFTLPAHRLRDVRPVGVNHLRLALEGPDGGRMEAMAFRAADAPLGTFLMQRRGHLIHLAGTLSADHWQGTRRVQFRVIDAAAAI